MNPGAPVIRGDFYAGAYGPTILLVLRSHEGVALLRGVFVGLAAGTRPPVRLDLEPGVDLAGVEALTLVTAKANEPVGLRRTNSHFRWSSTTAGWQRLTRLLEPFLEGKTGHQYLTDEPDDDAIVTVSYGEPDVSLK